MPKFAVKSLAKFDADRAESGDTRLSYNLCFNLKGRHGLRPGI
ncbi:hypothetical protein CAMRE0001_2495 [Campylobacter rectus RM3267]|uniref:Uncharacterized protein n=1 Tax=Campylobacter rectus RM3267 TaxID=553218 RepID=B9D5D1_CAMRE|nr:hypothetical protein CAMRE0001_2495 [Campylobacter rectus RM3267]